MNQSLQQEQQYMIRLLKGEIEQHHLDPLMANKLLLQRKIITWWRCFQFEHWLILTSKMLKDHTLFESLVASLYRTVNISSYPANAGEQFVEHILSQPVPDTIKAVASMEISLIRLKDENNKNEYRIFWPQSPMVLLDALIHGNPYSLVDRSLTTHEMVLSNGIQGKMLVYELN